MHIMAERAWIRTRGTIRYSRFQGECLKPGSAIPPNWRKWSESNAHIVKDVPLRTTNLKRAARERLLHAMLAESIRFERMTPQQVFRVSSAVPSTTRPTLRIQLPWCRPRASNPHVRGHCVLNAARLPIPPGRHIFGRSEGSRTPKPEGA